VSGKKIIVHISEGGISPTSGMGRVSYHWQNAFKKHGFEFIDIAPAQLEHGHYSTFPQRAYNYYKKLSIKPAAILVHEPAAYKFLHLDIPVFLFSHGVESRVWEVKKKHEHISLKSKITFPLLRLRNANKGLRKTGKLLLINSDDVEYVKRKFGRAGKDIFLFKNGYNTITNNSSVSKSDNEISILFNGSWITRKGINTMVMAARELHKKNKKIKWVLAGVGTDENIVRNAWPSDMQNNITVISRFPAEQELELLANTDIFLLPSLLEGQPLSLIQAMAYGKCCITTNCCGQKDLVSNGKTGLLFEPGNYKELEQLLEKCIADKSLRDTLGKNAHEALKNRTWENVSNEVVNYVTSFIKVS